MELEEQFDEMLDDCYGMIKIGDIHIWASDVLKNCDPIAYRIGLSEYEDSLQED